MTSSVDGRDPENEFEPNIAECNFDNRPSSVGNCPVSKLSKTLSLSDKK